MKQKAVIVDLDGTAANIDHRNPYDTSRCDLDPPNEDVKWFVNLVLRSNDSYEYGDGSVEVIFCSGRKEKARKNTETFLHKFTDGVFDPNSTWGGILFMRKNDDNRPDNIVKEEIYRTHIEPHYDVIVCIDDRTKVVNQWRSMGLKCWQVRPGDF